MDQHVGAFVRLVRTDPRRAAGLLAERLSSDEFQTLILDAVALILTREGWTITQAGMKWDVDPGETGPTENMRGGWFYEANRPRPEGSEGL